MDKILKEAKVNKAMNTSEGPGLEWVRGKQVRAGMVFMPQKGKRGDEAQLTSEGLHFPDEWS